MIIYCTRKIWRSCNKKFCAYCRFETIGVLSSYEAGTVCISPYLDSKTSLLFSATAYHYGQLCQIDPATNGWNKGRLHRSSLSPCMQIHGKSTQNAVPIPCMSYPQRRFELDYAVLTASWLSSSSSTSSYSSLDDLAWAVWAACA